LARGDVRGVSRIVGRASKGRDARAQIPLSSLPSFLQLRYANNSGYKAQGAKDEMITREVFVSQLVLDEVKRIVEDSEVGAVSAHRATASAGTCAGHKLSMEYLLACMMM